MSTEAWQKLEDLAAQYRDAKRQVFREQFMADQGEEIDPLVAAEELKSMGIDQRTLWDLKYEARQELRNVQFKLSLYDKYDSWLTAALRAERAQRADND